MGYHKGSARATLRIAIEAGQFCQTATFWRTGTWLEAILNTAGRSVICIPINFKALGSGGLPGCGF